MPKGKGCQPERYLPVKAAAFPGGALTAGGENSVPEKKLHSSRANGSLARFKIPTGHGFLGAVLLFRPVPRKPAPKANG